jgi:hypothetical protein
MMSMGRHDVNGMMPIWHDVYGMISRHMSMAAVYDMIVMASFMMFMS